MGGGGVKSNSRRVQDEQHHSHPPPTTDCSKEALHHPKGGRAGGRPAARPTEEKMGGADPRRPRRWSAGRTKRKPPKHGFYSCCASKKHPRRGRQIADSIRDLHPKRAKQVHKKVFSPRNGALCTGGGREAAQGAAGRRRTGGHFATVLGTGEIGPSTDRLQPQILTTVSGIEAILEVQYEGGW